MAPAICSFTSELFYEGRLTPLPGLERQALAGVPGLEAFYGFSRSVPLVDANRSLSAMEQALWLNTVASVPASVRAAVLGYNQDDCVNGRDYYALHGSEVQVPVKREVAPSREYLDW